MENNRESYNAIIIGSGCLGASVFRALKLKNIDNVLIIDKGKMGGGISSQSGGMVRVFHKKIQDRIAAKYSQEVFYNLEREIGLNISQVGSLSIIPKEEVENIGHGFKILGHETLKNKFQDLRFSKDEVGIYEEKGASICVKEYVKKIIRHYKTKNDALFENTYVHKIDSTPKGVHRVITSSGIFCSPKVIVTSGLGLKKILPEIYEDKNIEKREIATYQVNAKSLTVIPNFFDYTKIFYGTNSFKGEKGNFRVGIKSGSRNSRDKVEEYSRKRFQIDFEIAQEKSSAIDIYTKTKDGLLGEVCGRKGLYVLSGWGGGAFKFSPYLGHKIVEEITAYET